MTPARKLGSEHRVSHEMAPLLQIGLKASVKCTEMAAWLEPLPSLQLPYWFRIDWCMCLKHVDPSTIMCNGCVNVAVIGAWSERSRAAVNTGSQGSSPVYGSSARGAEQPTGSSRVTLEYQSWGTQYWVQHREVHRHFFQSHTGVYLLVGTSVI